MNGEHPHAWQESDSRPRCLAHSYGYHRVFQCRLFDEHPNGHWFGIERVTITYSDLKL